MKWSLAIGLALALAAGVTGPRSASAQGVAAQCTDFTKLRDDAQTKALAISNANQKTADRKQVCTLVTAFFAAESKVVKFLIDNKSWCSIPDNVIVQAKSSHEKTSKFRTMVCTEAPQPGKPKAPTLSEAIGTPAIDSAKNTRTGRGTFDTLTGNPLAK